MQSITLSNVLPHVFAQRSDLKSEIWKQNVKFEKGKLYLVEAMSGTGKSTLCSYILGYRHDYTGLVRFDNTDVKTLTVSNWVDIRQRNISHLFQELRLLYWFQSHSQQEVQIGLPLRKQRFLEQFYLLQLQ